MTDKNVFWSKTALTGGGATALDSIDGAALQDGEIAHVWVSNVLYVYRLDVDSAAAESSPNIIAPDANAGDKRWILQPAYANILTGEVVQVVSTAVVTSSTGSTALPYDDSIPQKTEGDEYMTLAVTPKSATNTLIIDVTIHLSNAVNGDVAAALFQDTTAGALASGLTIGAAAGLLNPIHFTHTMVAGTVSATTFKVRGGSTSGTTTFNGVGGARKHGGVLVSSIKITEIQA